MEVHGARFESYDFVANWYRKAHARRASSTKITQVNACFAQGREYFRNAHPAAMSVKPLLLYYGVLACCRGVILANDPQKKEGIPKASVTALKWWTGQGLQRGNTRGS